MRTKRELNKKAVLCALYLIVFWFFVAWLFGCAKVDVVLSDGTEFHSFTVLKDINIDPNGVASTTSSATDSVIGGIVGFFTAWIAE